MIACAHRDCTAEGTAHPVLLAMPADHPEFAGPPVQMILGILVCPAHQAETKAADLVSDEGWDRILAAFHMVGRAAPDRETLGLAWQRPDLPAGRLPAGGRA